MKLILYLFLICILFGCRTNSTNSLKTKIDTSINLYAFVGKRISVTEFNPNKNNIETKIDSITGDTIITERLSMDYAFKAKYLVLNNLYNDLNTNTIEFVAYDHYGRPEFEKFDTVILYISKSDSNDYFFHQKYHYDPIFKDRKGNCFTYPKFLGTIYTPYIDSLKSFRVNLKNVKIPVGNINEGTAKSYYPKEFYKIEDGIARPYRGVYLDEIIRFRLETSFKNLKKNPAQ